ncbi:Peptidase M50B-like [Tenacibaculum sp. MAR_2009_124]|uniref:M50 family metallopeptidase n=1 Tax=Tenacibaculum sp. MAR_2009_124 TaxID=1250059 RepID=UPI000895DD9E|nr:M50 family metallopeptidase [Tenacibaculum sp. MAR_2009_124]SEC33390.1 Peptidase M50B-like [Tenacibaculum sp. MAR_2009_124]
MKRKQHYIPLLLTLLVFILLQLPGLTFIQYPFRLLGTWFHEMGHGISALLVGGQFMHLEIYENGGGVAYSNVSNSYLPYHIARAITAAGGLLGATITGSICIVAAKKPRSTTYALATLLFIIILSLILWIRSFWGILILSAFAVGLLIVFKLQNKNLQKSVLLFLGLQAALSSYYELGYVFTKQFERFGKINYSDTETIAQNTFGTYWFWGIIISAINLYIITKAIVIYFENKKSGH